MGALKIIAIMPVRNEAWVLGLSLRAALEWCDDVMVGLHDCTDESKTIVREIQAERGKVAYCEFVGGTWTEMAHRQTLLNGARAMGATHIVILDADEVLTGNLLALIEPAVFDRWGKRQSVIGYHVTCLATGTVLQLPWLALPRTIDRYLTAGAWGLGQQVSMSFVDQPSAHWALHDGRDFHHRNPMGIGRSFRAPLKPEQGGLMHLQFLGERRLRAKQALYKAVEMIRWPAPCMLEGKYCANKEMLAERLNWMYGRAVYESDPAKYASAPCPESWWQPYERLMKYLDVDAEPWQEGELKRLIAEHGGEKLAGLDFFGVA